MFLDYVNIFLQIATTEKNINVFYVNTKPNGAERVILFRVGQHRSKKATARNDIE